MSDNEIQNFIRTQSRRGRLSTTVRSLNTDVLSEDRDRRRRAEAAIRKLGFVLT